MRKLGTVLLAAASLLTAADLNLMPWPASVRLGEGRLKIDSGFSLSAGGCPDERVKAAAIRAGARLKRQTGVDVVIAVEPDLARAHLILDCEAPGGPVRKAVPPQKAVEDESYQLTITAHQATLKAPNPIGILRAVETFLQLVERDGDGFSLPAVAIDDHPRFPWRGLLLDCVRHFMPVEVVKRTLDGMALVKMNVFHWHLTDDQGFRLESKVFPKLHLQGSDGLYYTQDQIRDIVGYAGERGIRVVPEIEMPGHATSWFVGFPELASAPVPFTIERRWGGFEPVMDPAREDVYRFLNGLFREVASLFPDDYVHIGGDEVEAAQWNRSAAIQAFMKERGLADPAALHAYFNRRVQALLKEHDRKMIGWDEVFHSGLPQDVLIQSWRGAKTLAGTARKGYQSLLSYGYYLDHVRPASVHYLNDPMQGDAASLDSAERSRILGGEACMWAEYVSSETLDSRVWPRTAAIAERLWSPQSVRDVDSMYRRLQVASEHLETLGLTHRSAGRLMLRRMAGAMDPRPVEILQESLEPVKFLSRLKWRQYTQETPLDRLVDATPPESEAARSLRAWASNWNSHRQQIRGLLSRWRDNHIAARPVLERSPMLREALPLSAGVHDLSEAGLGALDHLEKGRKAPNPWLIRQRQILERVALPHAELTIAAVDPVRMLIEAAGTELRRGGSIRRTPR